MTSKKNLQNCADRCFCCQMTCASVYIKKCSKIYLINFSFEVFFWILDSMVGDANYCRNTDSSSKPWCYVQGETGLVKEYCNIPSCGKWLFNIVRYWESLLYNCIKIILSWNCILYFFKSKCKLHLAPKWSVNHFQLSKLMQLLWNKYIHCKCFQIKKINNLWKKHN